MQSLGRSWGGYAGQTGGFFIDDGLPLIHVAHRRDYHRITMGHERTEPLSTNNPTPLESMRHEVGQLEGMANVFINALFDSAVAASDIPENPINEVALRAY